MPKRPARGTDPAKFDFDKEQKVMKMYSDNAGLYIKLSGSALALMVAFPEKFLHAKIAEQHPNLATCSMGACFLAAAVAGAFYQYVAAKYMEMGEDPDSYRGAAFCEPGTIYGIMLGFFHLGAAIFTGYAVSQILQ